MYRMFIIVVIILCVVWRKKSIPPTRRVNNMNAALLLRTVTPSKRVLCYSDSGAGLSDRKAVFTQLSRWATALNVQLGLPPPCLLLTPKHNNGQRLNCNFTWSRYFDFPSGVLTNEPCSLHMNNFFKLTKYVKQVKTYNTGSQVSFSIFVKNQTNLLMERMMIPSVYDMIHIRRGDSTDSCDTSLSTMEKLLKKRDFATKHVIYSSDEKNETYNNAIAGFLRIRKLKVYLIEPELRKRFKTDNYMAYAISRVIFKRATRTHEWRRHYSCPQPKNV